MITESSKYFRVIFLCLNRRCTRMEASYDSIERIMSEYC